MTVSENTDGCVYKKTCEFLNKSREFLEPAVCTLAIRAYNLCNKQKQKVQ